MKKKKLTISKLKKKCWEIFSKYIRKKYAYENGYVMCITCPTMKPWKEMHAGHFIDGRTNSILFEEEGVHPQCPQCNIWLHGNKIKYFRYMQFIYGEKIIKKLEKLANKNKQFTREELENKIKYYKKKLGEL